MKFLKKNLRFELCYIGLILWYLISINPRGLDIPDKNDRTTHFCGT
jgi:hypothetical protein